MNARREQLDQHEDPRHSPDQIVAAAANWEEQGWSTGERLKAALSILRTETLIKQQSTSLLRDHKLTYSRHELLALLYFSRQGEMALGRISARLLLHPTSVTSTVDALEKLGFVERLAHPTDRRAILARITDEGRRMVEETTPELARNGCGLLALTSEEATTLFEILQKVRVAAGDPIEPDSPPNRG